MIRTFANRTYFAITAVITVIMLLFGYYDALKTKELILIEKQQTLTKIAIMLDQMLPPEVEEAIMREDVQQMSHRQKAELFNKDVQSILNQLVEKFPGYGIGYGIEKRIAGYPFKPEILELPMAKTTQKMFETKELVVDYNPNSVLWDGAPALTVTYPRLHDGEVVAYSWANIKVEDIDSIVVGVWTRNMGVYLAIWIFVLFVLHDVITTMASRIYQLQERLKEENRSLCQSEERFRKAFDMNPNVMVILSDARYIDVNESFVKAIGRERGKIIGKTIHELNLWYDDTEKLEFERRIHRQGKVYNFEMKFRTVTGARAAMLTADRITLEDKQCFLVVLTDLEDKKQQEESMARFERLNIIGEMAAGIGHEVRNPMTTVRGYLQLFQRKETFREYYEQINTMVEELDRANSIITEFLSLAKNKSVEMSQGNLNQSIHSLFPLLQANAFQLGHQIEIETRNIPDIQLNEKEIRQLILNLARNGFEAMKCAGKLTISTDIENNKIILAVRDSGPGIPDDVMAKLGTPFVTTKEAGTGLGVPICYRIAQRHSALIDVRTGKQGTTFFVYFPLGRGVVS